MGAHAAGGRALPLGRCPSRGSPSSAPWAEREASGTQGRAALGTGPEALPKGGRRAAARRGAGAGAGLYLRSRERSVCHCTAPAHGPAEPSPAQPRVLLELTVPAGKAERGCGGLVSEWFS